MYSKRNDNHHNQFIVRRFQSPLVYKGENVRHSHVTKTLKHAIFFENPGDEGVVSDKVSVFFPLITVFLEQMTLVPYDTNFYLMTRESSIS